MGTAFTLFERAKAFLAASPQQLVAQRLYAVTMAAARQPALYVDGGIPDTIDGRFDVLSLHLFLVLRRLKGEGAEGRALGQRLFDVAFANFDETLREMGVGDLSVGKKVRKMAEAFYGRLEAYETALSESDEAFQAALVRNIYRGTAPDNAQLAALKSAVTAFGTGVETAPASALLTGSWTNSASS